VSVGCWERLSLAPWRAKPIMVLRLPSGALDFSPAGLEHLTPGELDAWRAWDACHEGHDAVSEGGAWECQRPGWTGSS